MIKNQKGLGHILIIVIVLVVAAIGLVGWRVANSKSHKVGNSSAQLTDSATGSKVTWMEDQNGWSHSGNLPACPNPINLPVDINKVTSILYPGQTRGGEYKPHGGFRFDSNSDNKVNIAAPFDVSIYRGAKYPVGNDTQYVFDFINPCGYMIRFGHLLTLAPKLQAIADKLPMNGQGDSRDTRISPQTEFNAGEILATATGTTTMGSGPGGINVFVDWGVYNLRTKNQSSQNADWAAKHTGDTEQHAICWLDFLSPSDEAKVKALPAGDSQSGKTSDYCK